MTVELVSKTNAENRLCKKLPAVISVDAADCCADAPPDGSYRCLIGEVDDHLVVWDLGAKGGTFVNGVSITKASLGMGDTLRLGGREFAVRYDRGPRRYLFGVRC
jgi:hypothetical protein